MIEYKKHHATAKETILDKTGQWLLNKNEFRNWRSSKASSILWLHGIRRFYHSFPSFWSKAGYFLIIN